MHLISSVLLVESYLHPAYTGSDVGCHSNAHCQRSLLEKWVIPTKSNWLFVFPLKLEKVVSSRNDPQKQSKVSCAPENAFLDELENEVFELQGHLLLNLSFEIVNPNKTYSYHGPPLGLHYLGRVMAIIFTWKKLWSKWLGTVVMVTVLHVCFLDRYVCNMRHQAPAMLIKHLRYQCQWCKDIPNVPVRAFTCWTSNFKVKKFLV